MDFEPPEVSFARFAQFVLISIIAMLCLVGARTVVAQPVELEHGHLATVAAVVDTDGVTLSARDHAFLAIYLETVPEAPAAIDYTQTVTFLSNGRYELPSGGTIARSVPVSEAQDGWILLPLSRPCVPGQEFTLAGLVTVCPPRDYETGTLVHACSSPTSGVAPLFHGFPPENIRCMSKRRAVSR